jgi:hypothetical protein
MNYLWNRMDIPYLCYITGIERCTLNSQRNLYSVNRTFFADEFGYVTGAYVPSNSSSYYSTPGTYGTANAATTTMTVSGGSLIITAGTTMHSLMTLYPEWSGSVTSGAVFNYSWRHGGGGYSFSIVHQGSGWTFHVNPNTGVGVNYGLCQISSGGKSGDVLSWGTPVLTQGTTYTIQLFTNKGSSAYSKSFDTNSSVAICRIMSGTPYYDPPTVFSTASNSSWGSPIDNNASVSSFSIGGSSYNSNGGSVTGLYFSSTVASDTDIAFLDLPAQDPYGQVYGSFSTYTPVVSAKGNIVKMIDMYGKLD